MPAHTIEIRPGEGGDDATVFAAELVGAITAALTRNGTAHTVDTGDGRTTTITTRTAAPAAIRRLAGTHRIQRIPANDKRGRRHTSTATVAILRDTPAGGRPAATGGLEIEWFSGSGAGGQHRNRSRNCCKVTDQATGMTAVGTSNRSRKSNLAEATNELRRRLHQARLDDTATTRNEERRSQVNQDRAAKTWTWNAQRDEVLDHTTGHRHRMRDALKGKFATR